MCTYAGELLSNREADQRLLEYDKALDKPGHALLVISFPRRLLHYINRDGHGLMCFLHLGWLRKEWFCRSLEKFCRQAMQCYA